MMRPDSRSSAPAVYPQMRLDADALDHNIAVMAAWCREHDVDLSPHVKTTMSAPIVERQVAAGTRRLTVATIQQAATVLGWGHRRVLIANEVVHGPALQLLSSWLQADEAVEISCFVDSSAGVEAIRRVFDGAPRPLDVMVDVGAEGGRTGVRHLRDARELAEVVHAARGARLTGVAGFEGVVPNARDVDTLARVDQHCRRVSEAFVALSDLYETDHPVISMGGSVFPDRAVMHMADTVRGAVREVRSGCYVTHDHGTYALNSPLRTLRAAVTVDAVVLSAPEPGTVVVGAGRRELPHDAGLPTLVARLDRNGERSESCSARADTMYDHHLVLTDVVGLAVGDVAELGISHPCSVFDRWDDYVVHRGDARVDVWDTDFSRSSVVTPNPRPH